MRQVLVLVSLLWLASCGGRDGSPTAPTQPPIAAGTWQGPFTTDTGSLAGTLRLVLMQQTNGSVTGTATLTLPGLTLPNGSVTGGVQPGATPPVPIGLAITVAGNCPATLSAPSTFTTVTTLEGVVAGGNPVCGIDIAGRFALQKQ